MWPSASAHTPASQRGRYRASKPSRRFLAIATAAFALSAVCSQQTSAKEQAPLAFLDSGLIISGAQDNVNQVAYWEGERENARSVLAETYI